MPSKLPALSWRDVLKILNKSEFRQTGQTGSHIFLTDGKHKVTVPRHKEIKKGTLLSIISQAGLTKEEFFNRI
ncbi:MAG TPA: type II toxin-antitoxin system HicA family toxin [Candidatus Nitrosotenuis sp.]|nr:type II toxin-antitoxin system HicA family toxin [Candidatus Nitrosotenuis sp.]